MFREQLSAIKKFGAFRRFFSTIFLLMVLFAKTEGKEQVIIVEVGADGRLITVAGDTLQLANVQAVSINDPDSLRAEFARTVTADAAKMLNGKQVFIEPITMQDSVQVVLMWLPSKLGKRSVNAHFLQKGWGFFKETPTHRYLENFRSRTQYAKAVKIGVFAEKAKEEPPLLQDAFWLSGGIGGSNAKRTGRQYYRDYLNLNASMALRHKLWMGDIGVNLHGTCCHTIRTFYTTFGVSSHNRAGEFTAAIGPSLSRWTYNTESERGTIHSDDLVGAMVKVQAFVHAPRLIGMGIELSANFNSDQTTYLMSFNLYWGEWNF